MTYEDMIDLIKEQIYDYNIKIKDLACEVGVCSGTLYRYLRKEAAMPADIFIAVIQNTGLGFSVYRKVD